MANKELKITYTGDTTVYRKEVDAASKATQKFSKDAGKSLVSLADVFGVNLGGAMDTVGDMSKKFGLLHEAMKKTPDGAASVTTSATIIRTALQIASGGLLVVIAAFASLITYFTQTERGAEFVERAMAGLRAGFRVLIDHAAKFGEGIFLIFSGKFGEGWNALKESMSNVGKEMKEETKAAWENQKAYQDLEDKQRDLITVQAERERQISALREKAKELETSPEAKIGLLQKAMEIEKTKAAADLEIANEKLSLLKKEYEMSEKRDEMADKIAKAQVEATNIQTALNNSINSYQKELKAAHNQIEENLKAEQKKNDEARKALIEDVGGKPEKMKSVIDYVPPKDKPGLASLSTKLEGDAARVKVLQDDLAANTINFTETFKTSLTGAAEGFGEFLGDLLTGEASLADFGSFVALQFAELAITVGKLLIGFGIAGTALEAIAKAHPAAAIVAGIALVGLGTAAKNAVGKAIANRGGGATSSAAVSSSGNSYNYDARQSAGDSKMQTVNVTVGGEFTLKNGVLTAQIAQENQRRLLVT